MEEFIPVTYPMETVKALEDYHKTKQDFLDQADHNATYRGNQGYETPSVYISPDYSLTINGREVTVYTTLVYIGSGEGRGALHSYAMVEILDSNQPLDIRLTSLSHRVTQVRTLPVFLGQDAVVDREREIYASITGCGSYTFVTNSDREEISQDTAFTLFVRPYADEEAQIEAFRSMYGRDHVLVFEPGVHYFSHINIEKDDMVLYIRRGALLVPEHDKNVWEGHKPSEPDVCAYTSSGMNRWAVITVWRRKNIRIMGHGAIDFGRLDHEERGCLRIAFSEAVSLEGITLLNPPGWTMMSYCTKNLSIRNVVIFGYKTNSDGFAVCNSQNVTVSDCYARSGDDLFEVKTVGSTDAMPVRDVLFTNCYAWAGKARCFGLIHETSRDVERVRFRHCAVLFRDSTWNNEILGSLMVLIGEGKGNVSDILFEDIEIYRDSGHPILAGNIREDQPVNRISCIVFKDIRYTADLPILLHTPDGQAASLEVTFEHIIANGQPMTIASAAEAMTVAGPHIAYAIV